MSNVWHPLFTTPYKPLYRVDFGSFASSTPGKRVLGLYKYPPASLGFAAGSQVFGVLRRGVAQREAKRGAAGAERRCSEWSQGCVLVSAWVCEGVVGTAPLGMSKSFGVSAKEGQPPGAGRGLHEARLR